MEQVSSIQAISISSWPICGIGKPPSREGARHEGILLYPEVDTPLAADIRLEGFRIRARTINLSQDWRFIHRDMLRVIE